MGARTTAILMTVILAVLLAGCGGNEPKNAGAATSTPTAAKKKAAVALPAGQVVFRRYTDDAHNTGALFTVSTDGSAESQLTHPPSDFVDDHPDYSPDGKQVVFERCQEGNGGGDAVVNTFKPCSVWTVPAAGGDARQIHLRCQLDPCDARSPAWAPDGKLLLTLDQGPVKVLGDFNQLKQSSAEQVDPATGKQRTIYKRANWEGDVGYPAVSPDGRTLLYSRRNSPRSKPPVANSLFAVGMDGKNDHQVTPWKLGGGDHANFTPDGAVLFRSYEEDESLQSQLYTVSTDGKQLHQLTHFPDQTLLLSFSASPDGKWIVIGHKADRAAGDADVSVLAADGSGDPQPLVSAKQWDSAPDWAPQ
jgi:Tol biopolymer transport system component